MKIGDMIYHWPNEENVGLIIGLISDEWSDRILVFSEGEIFEVPFWHAGVFDEIG
tara:strand:- start:299 stop:463 length:165 start_codon:yes stop_codon:yes gene_type:complete